MTPFRSPALLPILAGALALAGCGTPLKKDGAVSGPFYAPANVQSTDRLPAAIRRVALLPCAADGPALTEDSLIQLDAILSASLTRAARAEVSPVGRDALNRLAGRRALVSTSLLPAGFMSRAAALTGADAVLLVDVTAYSPYPPQIIGLRGRLVDIGTGVQLWGFDSVFNAADPAVANSARRHVLKPESATETPADFSRTILQNPSRFADYAATAMWATLPPR